MGEFILEFEMLFEPFWGFIFEGGYTILKGGYTKLKYTNLYSITKIAGSAA